MAPPNRPLALPPPTANLPVVTEPEISCSTLMTRYRAHAPHPFVEAYPYCVLASYRYKGFWRVSDFRSVRYRRMGRSRDFLDGKDCLYQTICPVENSPKLPQNRERSTDGSMSSSRARWWWWSDCWLLRYRGGGLADVGKECDQLIYLGR